ADEAHLLPAGARRAAGQPGRAGDRVAGRLGLDRRTATRRRYRPDQPLLAGAQRRGVGVRGGTAGGAGPQVGDVGAAGEADLRPVHLDGLVARRAGVEQRHHERARGLLLAEHLLPGDVDDALGGDAVGVDTEDAVV